MKIIYNHLIPFDGFYMTNLYGTIFMRKKHEGKPIKQTDLNHEAIHTEQMRDFCRWLPVGGTIFYIVYLLNWLVNLVVCPSQAYRNIVFEREAYEHDQDLNYLQNRKRFAWTHLNAI